MIEALRAAADAAGGLPTTVQVALIGGVVVILGGILTYAATRGKTQADAKASLDARIDERVEGELDRVWRRLDDVERISVAKASAFARILRQIAEQWPDPGGPNIDPRDLAIVEETVPPRWLRNPKEGEQP